MNRSFSRLFSVDKAVAYTSLLSIVRMVAGPILILLILRKFNPLSQGLYYTFNSIVALQIFFELGFTQNILQFGSHEFSYLRINELGLFEGPETAKSRLISLGRRSLACFLIMGIFFILIVGPIGTYFIQKNLEHKDEVEWLIPWWILCFSTSISLVLNAVLTLLQSLDFAKQIAQIRILVMVLNAGIASVMILNNFNLYSIAVSGIVSNLAGFFIVFVFSKNIINNFLHTPKGPQISFWKEVWPFQWRISLSWISGYFISYFSVPLVFATLGAVSAGRFGMTQQLFGQLSILGSSWMNVHLFDIAAYTSQKRWSQVDALWLYAVKKWVLVVFLGLISFVFGFLFLQVYWPSVVYRVAPLNISLIVGITTLIAVPNLSIAALLRAHKKEPFLLLSVISACLSTFIGFLGAKYYQMLGTAVGYLFVQLISTGWGIFLYFKYKNRYRLEAELQE